MVRENLSSGTSFDAFTAKTHVLALQAQYSLWNGEKLEEQDNFSLLVQVSTDFARYKLHVILGPGYALRKIGEKNQWAKPAEKYSGQGKDPFPLARPPLGRASLADFFLSDPVFCLFPPLRRLVPGTGVFFAWVCATAEQTTCQKAHPAAFIKVSRLKAIIAIILLVGLKKNHRKFQRVNCKL